MCCERALFDRFDRNTKGIGKVYGAGNHQLEVQGVGDVVVECLFNGHPETTVFTNVLYVPDCGINLLSASQFTKIGCSGYFNSKRITISKGGQAVCCGKLDPRTDLYLLELVSSPIVNHQTVPCLTGTDPGPYPSPSLIGTAILLRSSTAGLLI